MDARNWKDSSSYFCLWSHLWWIISDEILYTDSISLSCDSFMSLRLVEAGLWTTWGGGGGCWGRIITSEVMMSLMMRWSQLDEWFLGSSEGEICTLLLLISDFYLSCWRNSSVTISDQSVRCVTTNHLCHEELITRDSLFWSLIVTPLWHHSLSPLSLWWQHSTVHSHWLQFSQTLDCVSTWHQCWQHDRHPGTDWGWPLLPLTNIRTRGNILDKFIRISNKRMEMIER